MVGFRSPSGGEDKRTGESNARSQRSSRGSRRRRPYAVHQSRHGAERRAGCGSCALCRPRAPRTYQFGWEPGRRGHLRAGRAFGTRPECRSRSQPAAAAAQGNPRLLVEPRLRVGESGHYRRPGSNRARQRERHHRGRHRSAFGHSDSRLPPARRHPGGSEQGKIARGPYQDVCQDSPQGPRSRLSRDRRALDRGVDGPVRREDGEGESHLARSAGSLGVAQPYARGQGHGGRPAHRGDRPVALHPARRADRAARQRDQDRHIARTDGETEARLRSPLRHRDRCELLAPHRWCFRGPADERRNGPGAWLRRAHLHPFVRGCGGRSRLAAAPGADLCRAHGAGACGHPVEGPRPDRASRSIRGAGAVESPGLRRKRLGDQRGHHQRHGWLDRDRPPLRRDRRPDRHHALQRNAPSRCPVRPHLRVRTGRHGIRHGAGAPLMSTIARPPARSAPAVTWDVQDGIATVVLDLKGQPVNVISRAVKDEFVGCFAALADDASVRAVAFFSGKAENFIAGADIEEFVRLSSAAEAERLAADGQEMLDRVARFPKPIAVGIHGACLGGGFEFALACHYRVATDHPKRQIGLPEVQLGILPAAGGCQRLPRLVGLRAALDIILAGKTERAAKAFRVGMIDELVPPSILTDITLAAARRMAGGWRPKRKRLGGFLGFLLDGNPLGRRMVFRMARKQVLERTGGNYPAPLAALEAVEYGLGHGIAEGLKREAQLFGQLAVTDVSRKLVQIFFATNQLKKDPGIPNAPPPVRVQRLGIIGSGFMGSGIAGTAVAQAEVDVRMKDAELGRVAQGILAARAILDDRLKRRRITKYEYARLVALLSGSDTYAGFGRAELTIEAVFEELAVKQQVLREVEAMLPPTGVFASNTSTIPITRIAEAARAPERVIGMHFFSPVAKMPLLEVIPGARTEPQTGSTAVAFGRRMGKTVIVVKDSPGFWVNRILAPYPNEVGHLLAEGASIEDIDSMAVRFGFPVGPVTLLDEVGLDVAVKVAGVMQEAYGDHIQPAPGAGIAALVKEGRLGRKSGRGFYLYEDGKKRGVDESAYGLLGVHPNGGPRPAEILQRLVLGMVNEAARAVGEGVVRSPRDGDIGAIFGFGFPPFRGGPLRYADDLGPERVMTDLQRLAERHGARFAPCEVLQEHARAGTKFYA